MILHIDMDYFFAQIEERENPRFRGKPVIVGADPKGGKGRGVVSTANYEARKYGIHSAMPISKAYELCPDAIFLPVNGELYSKVSENIMEIVRKVSLVTEQVSLDEAYVDISFRESWEQAKALGEKLKKEIYEKEKLTSTVGIGPNKMIAKIACEKAKPNGLMVVTPEEAEKFLEPLDIEEIPGIGPKTAAAIRKFLHQEKATVKDLKKIKKVDLKNLFGVVGETIYERARGIDESPVRTEEIIKSIGKEHTFEQDTRDPETLLSIFNAIIEELSQIVRARHLQFWTITVVCRFKGFETHTKSKTLKEPTNEERILKKEALILFLRFIVKNPKPIRLVGLRVDVVEKIR